MKNLNSKIILLILSILYSISNCEAQNSFPNVLNLIPDLIGNDIPYTRNILKSKKKFIFHADKKYNEGFYFPADARVKPNSVFFQSLEYEILKSNFYFGQQNALLVAFENNQCTNYIINMRFSKKQEVASRTHFKQICNQLGKSFQFIQHPTKTEAGQQYGESYSFQVKSNDYKYNMIDVNFFDESLNPADLSDEFEIQVIFMKIEE